MAKIILVDFDGNFLSNLEWYFFKQSEEYEIQTITNVDYLHRLFSAPQTADALVISEDMYFPEIERHNIAHIFTLTEDDVESGVERLDGRRMSKYTTSVPEMYNIITGIIKTDKPGSETDTANEASVIMVYSPVGGVGSTSVAVGLCASLYKNYKKVLFLSFEGLQTFGSFFSGDYTLESWQNTMFKAERDEAIHSLSEMVRSELCDYLPPYSSPLPSIPLCAEDYIHLINAIKSRRTYDYVVVDTGSEFTSDLNALMGIVNRVVVVFDSQQRCEQKMTCFLNAINYSDRNKFVFLHNRITPGARIHAFETKLSMSKYIIEDMLLADDYPKNINDFLGNKEFQLLTNAIL